MLQPGLVAEAASGRIVAILWTTECTAQNKPLTELVSNNLIDIDAAPLG